MRMTYETMMQTKSKSLVAAIVAYWLDNVDIFMNWPKMNPNTTLDWKSEAERCMNNAMSFV